MSTKQVDGVEREVGRCRQDVPTTFVLFSELDADSIACNLGRPDYSYYFILRGFRTVLERLGTVVQVGSPAEVDAVHDRCAAAGGDCVFLCFTPPSKAPTALRCPTVCVFAWEFSTIPNEMLDDDPRSDWRTVFERHGRAVTLSEHAARTVRDAMGEDFPIAVVPVPLPPRFAAMAPRRAGDGGTVVFRGTVFDSRSYGPYFERPAWPPPVQPPPPPPMVPAPPELQPVAVPLRSPLRASLSVSRYYGLLWYREAVRDLLLPRPAARAIASAGRWYGRARRIAAAPPPPEPVAAAAVEPVTSPPPAMPSEPEMRVRLDGVVYAAVFNPMDGRKNWQDLLTAFCFAFRDQPGATLVMKMVHGHRDAFEILLNILTRALAPFQCRVVALQGWMADGEYDALVAAADFYVNTSNGEGLCLPLMEFMAAGRPAIAPDHTAMADYVTPANAFVLRYTDEYNVWPHDTRDLFRTMRHRLDWQSLEDAFRASFRVATADPARYAAMGAAARDAVVPLCSVPVVQDRLERFLARVPA